MPGGPCPSGIPCSFHRTTCVFVEVASKGKQQASSFRAEVAGVGVGVGVGEAVRSLGCRPGSPLSAPAPERTPSFPSAPWHQSLCRAPAAAPRPLRRRTRFSRTEAGGRRTRPQPQPQGFHAEAAEAGARLPETRARTSAPQGCPRGPPPTWHLLHTCSFPGRPPGSAGPGVFSAEQS